jgi:hypothetical protein
MDTKGTTRIATFDISSELGRGITPTLARNEIAHFAD